MSVHGDNQQERRVLSLDFLAGLIVGEGCFNLTLVRSVEKRPSKGRRGVYLSIKPCFKIKMTDLETMKMVFSSFEYYGLPYYRSDSDEAGKGRRSYTAEARGLKRVKKYTDLFLPYLSGSKREAAEFVASFIDKRLSSRGAWQGYDEEDLDTIERLRSVNGIAGGKRLSLEILRDYMPRSGRKTRDEIVRAS
jgi:hypothetical protein